MTPQGGHASAAMNSMPGYPPAHQSPGPGPSPAGRGWNQPPQGSFPPAGMPTQGHGNMQMPGSAGGYQQTYGHSGVWGESNFGRTGATHPHGQQTNNFGGY